MHPRLHRTRLSLSLVLVLAACGDKDTATGAGTSTTGGGSETGPGVTTTGVTMSSDPTTSTAPSTDPSTSAAQTTEPTTSPTSPTSPTTTGVTTATTTGAGTTDASTGGSSTGAVECQIDQPAPGECDGKVQRPAPKLAGSPAAARGPRGPGLWVDQVEDEVAATTGCEFICPVDMGEAVQCDIFTQDCGPGEKCNSWANDGGSSWNATKCVPVDADPDGIGEPCVVEGSGVSGVDSCVQGAMCFGTNEDNIGTCVEQCSCSAEDPVCTTPNTTCVITNEASLVLCLPVCDPLDLMACSPDNVCIANPAGDFFICVVDASGDEGAVGDPCEFLNACDPGHFCGADTFPGCDIGCCSPYCDLGAPQCPQGLECVPWYEQGMAPKCFDDVGACLGA